MPFFGVGDPLCELAFLVPARFEALELYAFEE